jgi:transcriptional regulator with XRE-family HTH domain
LNYGKAIRIVRTAYGLTQGELAKRLNIGASHLSLVEARKREPSLKVVNDIAAVLGVPPHLLTLLASEPADLEDPDKSPEIAELAKSLLKLLVNAGNQPILPLSSKRPT